MQNSGVLISPSLNLEGLHWFPCFQPQRMWTLKCVYVHVCFHAEKGILGPLLVIGEFLPKPAKGEHDVVEVLKWTAESTVFFEQTLLT